MKKVMFVAVCAMVAIAGLVALNMGNGDDNGNNGRSRPKNATRRIETGRKIPSRSPEGAVRDAMKGMPKSKKPKDRRPIDIFANLSGKDRRLAEEMQRALDGNDFDATLAAAKKALASTNDEIRLSAVEAMSWFGIDALPELTGLMADSDERVANEAETAWELAIGEIDDASRRFSIAAAAMSTLSNKDHLTSISGQLEGAALELIDREDAPEKSDDARIAVVQTLVDIMESSPENGAAQAKEAYRTITGFTWVSIDEAEAYLLDPDNYELP